MPHNELTICSICGHNDGSGSLPALLESLEQLPGSRGLLISQARPDQLPAGIAWRKTAPLSYKQYSIFVMHCLQYFIESEYCLIVQNDGWVLNGQNFTDSLYDYDYVGAPCHAALLGGILKQRYTWVKKPGRIVVQNGGFSLRSRRFLEAPSQHGLVYIPDGRRPIFNEDIQLSGVLRPSLEACGYKFAPDQVAMQFAIEYLGPVFHDSLDFQALCGHHAPSRRLVQRKVINCTFTTQQLQSFFREVEVIKHIQSLGYDIRIVNTTE